MIGAIGADPQANLRQTPQVVPRQKQGQKSEFRTRLAGVRRGIAGESDEESEGGGSPTAGGTPGLASVISRPLLATPTPQQTNARPVALSLGIGPLEELRRKLKAAENTNGTLECGVLAVE